MLKTAEAEWRTHSDAAMAEVVARCEAAETALATAEPGAALAQRDAEIQHLRVEIERQGQVTEADISAVKAATEAEAEARLKMAQARWENTAAAALADTVARCEAAEAALANAKRVNAKRTDDDEYVHSLEREIKTLRATLVDREAAIVHAQAMQEHVRLGTVRDTPGMRWQPLTNRSDVGEEAPSEKDKSNRQLLRDVGVVVMAAAAAVLLFPKAEAMLPDNIRWQIETMGGLFAPSEVATAPAARPAIVASTQPKVEHPVMYASRSINVRTQPSTGSAIVVNLKRGAAVTVLEKRGSWDRVEAPGPQNVAAQGWVFNTYLAESDPGSAPVATAAAAPSPAAPASSNAAGPETPQAVAAPSPEPVAAGTVTPPAEAPAPTP